MWFEELKQQLHLTSPYQDPKQLEAIRKWCYQNLSKDIEYTGSRKEQYTKYCELARNYLDEFLPQTTRNVADEVNSIQYAASSGYHYFISKHARLPALVNTKNTYGMTPLHLSAAFGHKYTVQTLIENGATVGEKNLNGQYPIQCALMIPALCAERLFSNKKDIFNTLASKAPELLEHQDMEGNTVLHTMALHGLIDLMLPLLEKLPHLALMPNHAGYCPIHIAMLNGQMTVVEVLLSRSEVQTITDPLGRTLLHYAAEYATPQIVEQCCRYTPTVDIADDQGNTPWMLAKRANNQEAMDVLQQHGAHVHPLRL